MDVLSTPLEIGPRLAGQRMFITGATGFVGKVLVEKVLWSVPDVGKLLILVRPRAEQSAFERLRDEVLVAPIMARLHTLHGDDWLPWATRKIEVVSGDLGQDRFGLRTEVYDALCQRIDLVVGNAATVTFDERLDRALALNTRGAARTLALARDAGNVPLVHVSTSFVSGRRTGTIPETVVDAETLDLDTTLAALDAAHEPLMARERATGALADRAWVAAGAAQAEAHGFNDIYTLTKALAERLLAERRGAVPVAIVRPAIVESAAREPFPGWIEAVRVSDPLLVAYGRGRTDSFPGVADTPLELIPVDMVAHAILAALADVSAGSEALPTSDHDPDAIPVYQVGSSRHPITLGQLMTYAREGFLRHPMRDENGEPVSVGPATFTEPEAYRHGLIARRKRVRASARWIPRRPDAPARRSLARAERTLDHLIHLLGVYRPYLMATARYDDTRTRALWDRLSVADQAAFPFDVTTIDWASYIADTHVPGLMRFALRAETGAPVPVPKADREPRAVILDRAQRHANEARSTFELFAATADAYGDVIAFQTARQGRWLRYTYDQARTATANLAARLATSYGVGPGDRVVLMATGSPEWIIATLAIHRLGAVSVPLDPQWPVAEAWQGARLVDAKLIAAMPPLVQALRATTGDEDCPVATLAAPFVPGPDVPLLLGVTDDPPVGTADDIASILFTSGTTVAPKAVPLTHGNYLANVRDLVPLMHLTRERLLSVLPIHHVFEQMVGWLVPMAGGSTFSYVAEIKPAEISWMMATTKPTVLVAVPRLLQLLHNGIQANVAAGGLVLKALFRVLFALSRRSNGAKGHKLFAKVHQRFGGALRRIATGGSALDPRLGRRFQLMGFQVAEGYGMTETSPVLSVNPWDGIRFGTVGRPLPHVEFDLRPPTDAADGVDPGAGEVWVRGPNVMAGYFQNPEATAAVMDAGWLNTGDIGVFDDDGYLRLSGRTKDVIVTDAGKNVYPEEVEARYADVEGVAELVILGLPGPSGGERVTALVVPTVDADESAVRTALDACSRDVPSYQRIAGVEFWRGDFPKTTTMKVKRAVLREAVVAGERGSGTVAAPPPSAPVASAEPHSEAESTVLETLARLTQSRADLIRSGDRLADLGVDSLTRVELIGELEARFGFRLDDDQAASLERVHDVLLLARSDV